ncbi:hypothetical protein DICPUDRAFT_158855 [Dictyostelium purpureum]|uniref:Uncharacterized protein n=1 Tax=Dictyostelium purpureum TaxID=5786 RepID=F1A2N6_DICPU|nr:uncharacterized protein DICPUDRAFT_158855 [Dictyostelium purpureum]EGC29542.1 hypothetical protein DICPUDRAFT_158855 [Dictyostelium purpureum]|eukprot:XP_003293932.1 hypothetical protein DICPUDRAFT_158855 [Dictyostelium purpureum]
MDQLNSEVLFWKVFRNSNIRSYIFNTQYEKLIKYGEIFDRFSNEETSIKVIRERVKNGERFACGGQCLLFDKIYECTEENEEFYNQLFSNYSPYFQIPEISLPLIIDTSNIVAFKVYIKKFNVKNNQLDSIINRYYNQSDDPELNNYQQLKYNIYDFKSFQFVHYLLLTYNTGGNTIDFNKIIDIYYYLFQIRKVNLTLGQLIELLKLFIQINFDQGSAQSAYLIISRYFPFLYNTFSETIEVLLALIKLDNVKLLEAHFQDCFIVSSFFGSLNIQNLILIMQSIKSSHVLKFFFQYYKNCALFNNGSEYWKFASNIQVVESYEQIFANNDKTLLVNSYTHNFSSNTNEIILLERALENYYGSTSSQSIYLLSDTFNIHTYSKIINMNYFKAIKNQDSILSLLKTLLKYRDDIDLQLLLGCPFKVLNWIGQNLKKISPHPTILFSKFSIELNSGSQLLVSSVQLFFSFLYSKQFNNAIEIIRIHPETFQYFDFEETNHITIHFINDFLDFITNEYFNLLEIEEKFQEKLEEYLIDQQIQKKYLNQLVGQTLMVELEKQIEDVVISKNLALTFHNSLKDNLKYIICSFLEFASSTGNNYFFINILNAKYKNLFIKKSIKNDETLLDSTTLSNIFANALFSNNVEIKELLLNSDFVDQDLKEEFIQMVKSYNDKINDFF